MIQDLCFIDIETTGLDPQHHEAIEVALIRTQPNGSVVKNMLEVKIKPEYIERASPKALQVNGYTEQEWLTALSVEQAVAQLYPVTAGVLLVGSNVSFDEGFLKTLYKKANKSPNWFYRKVDTGSLGWPLVVAGQAQGTGLKELCQVLRVPCEPDVHRAMNGALTCQQVYQALLQRLVPGQERELLAV